MGCSNSAINIDWLNFIQRILYKQKDQELIEISTILKCSPLKSQIFMKIERFFVYKVVRIRTTIGSYLVQKFLPFSHKLHGQELFDDICIFWKTTREYFLFEYSQKMADINLISKHFIFMLCKCFCGITFRSVNFFMKSLS